MNKKVKEVADSIWSLDIEPNERFNKSLQEFAELIIQECVTTAANFSIENKRFHPDINPVNMPIGQRMVYHSTCQSVSYEIKEHFGVRE
jgi:hypothetical protein